MIHTVAKVQFLNDLGQVPETESICKIKWIQIRQLVTFTLEGKYCIWSKPNIAIHSWREMNTEKRELWIRHLSKIQKQKIRKILAYNRNIHKAAVIQRFHVIYSELDAFF